MSVRELVRQLNAVKAIGPIHRYSTFHMRIDEDPIFIAFVRMAGESRPWAIAYGKYSDGVPKVISVPDGRNRNAVMEMCAELAEEMLEYFRVAGYTWDPITKENFSDVLMPQVWVPSSRHVEMFHNLQYAYWRVRKGDDRTQPITVFARLSGWLFRESTRLGQQVIIDTAKLFRESYVFPADAASLGHLGTCLKWFDEHEDLNSARFAVREATLLRDSPTLDPELDSKVFAPLIDKRNKLNEESKDTSKVDKQIHENLAAEVTRRWELVKSSYEVFQSDSRDINPGVIDLARATSESFYSQFQRIEEDMQDPDMGPAYTQHPETDFHGSAAASNYFVMTASDTAYIAKLVHDDEELQAEALASGKAFFADVVNVENLGTGRTTTPLWTLRVQIGEKLRIREGERYSPLKANKHGIHIRSVEVIDSETLEVTAEWVDRKTVPLDYPIFAKAVEPEWIGHRMMFVPKDGSEFDKSRSRAVWSARSGPGSWLTHGSAPTKVEPSIVDDITQLAGGN
jgi:hypothetical protein